MRVQNEQHGRRDRSPQWDPKLNKDEKAITNTELKANNGKGYPLPFGKEPDQLTENTWGTRESLQQRQTETGASNSDVYRSQKEVVKVDREKRKGC